MPEIYPAGDRITLNSHALNLTADVLVIGGSIAGTWAAYHARISGANVVLVDKGYVGTAGVVAAASCGGRYTLPNDPEQRRATIYQQHDIAGGIDDLAFIERVYDACYNAGKKLQLLGYAPGGEGPRSLTSFPGAYSMHFFRALLLKVGVQILDDSPALELLSQDGMVSGAAGVNRKTGESWAVRSGAVILATGGNAFRSGAMGTNGSTGDGYLMAAEVGASFTAMEYSGHYGIAPINSSCTKGFWYGSATFYDAQNRELPISGWQAVPDVARAIIETGAAFARVTKPNPMLGNYRGGSSAFHVYCRRVGIDPTKEKFQVELLLEGTVRATGGLSVSDAGATEVPGLFAAGDVSDRTRLTGASMSGAGPAIAWCLTSGEWSGRGAAAFAANRSKKEFSGPLEAHGRVGLRPRDGEKATAMTDAVIKATQGEMLPLEKNCFRSEAKLHDSLARLDGVWAASRDRLGGRTAREIYKAREAAALAATARWIYRAALERTETRGLHRRSDFPDTDDNQTHQLRVGGLEQLRVAKQPLTGAVLKSAEVESCARC